MPDSSTKKALRREVLQRLKAAAAADPAQLRSGILRSKLKKYLAGEPKTVALYAPLPHEINLLPLLQEHPMHRYVFPRCQPGNRLEFCIVRDIEQDLQPGAMNIPEPAAHTQCVSPDEIDLLIVPGVAFTRQGERLGYGGGYYDRFIPLCHQAEILALAFDTQMLESIPTEAHDLRIGLILTEKA